MLDKINSQIMSQLQNEVFAKHKHLSKLLDNLKSK